MAMKKLTAEDIKADAVAELHKDLCEMMSKKEWTKDDLEVMHYMATVLDYCSDMDKSDKVGMMEKKTGLMV